MGYTGPRTSGLQWRSARRGAPEGRSGSHRGGCRVRRELLRPDGWTGAACQGARNAINDAVRSARRRIRPSMFHVKHRSGGRSFHRDDACRPGAYRVSDQHARRLCERSPDRRLTAGRGHGGRGRAVSSPGGDTGNLGGAKSCRLDREIPSWFHGPRRREPYCPVAPDLGFSARRSDMRPVRCPAWPARRRAASASRQIGSRPIPGVTRSSGSGRSQHRAAGSHCRAGPAFPARRAIFQWRKEPGCSANRLMCPVPASAEAAPEPDCRRMSGGPESRLG